MKIEVLGHRGREGGRHPVSATVEATSAGAAADNAGLAGVVSEEDEEEDDENAGVDLNQHPKGKASIEAPVQDSRGKFRHKVSLELFRASPDDSSHCLIHVERSDTLASLQTWTPIFGSPYSLHVSPGDVCAAAWSVFFYCPITHGREAIATHTFHMRVFFQHA